MSFFDKIFTERYNSFSISCPSIQCMSTTTTSTTWKYRVFSSNFPTRTTRNFPTHSSSKSLISNHFIGIHMKFPQALKFFYIHKNFENMHQIQMKYLNWQPDYKVWSYTCWNPCSTLAVDRVLIQNVWHWNSNVRPNLHFNVIPLKGKSDYRTRNIWPSEVIISSCCSLLIVINVAVNMIQVGIGTEYCTMKWLVLTQIHVTRIVLHIW